ncbi:MAG: ferritin [Chitinophagales bacterium]
MLSSKIEAALNQQIEMESNASQSYLAMACWCDSKALEGCAKFLYAQAEEERMHMLKLLHYLNESGGFAITPPIKQPLLQFESILDLFQKAYENELAVSNAISELVDLCDTERDKQSANFLQWFLDEQHEEEATYRSLLDKIKLIGIEGRGLYFIDKEVDILANFRAANPE